jgi:hypothetical protein
MTHLLFQYGYDSINQLIKFYLGSNNAWGNQESSLDIVLRFVPLSGINYHILTTKYVLTTGNQPKQFESGSLEILDHINRYNLKLVTSIMNVENKTYNWSRRVTVSDAMIQDYLLEYHVKYFLFFKTI